MAIALAWFTLSVSATALQAPFPVSPEAQFVSSDGEQWTAFPSAGGRLVVDDQTVRIRGSRAQMEIEFSFPATWQCRIDEPTTTVIRDLRADGAHHIAGATQLSLTSADQRASLSLRLPRPDTLELNWHADSHHRLEALSLNVSGDLEQRAEVLAALRGSSHGTPDEWHAMGDGSLRLLREEAGAPPGVALTQELVFGTYLGGRNGDGLFALATASDGSLIGAGGTGSLDFPTARGAYDPIGDLLGDACVVGLSPDGSALVFATFFGGSANDLFRFVQVAGDGTLILAGETASDDLPTTPGAFDSTWNGGGVDPFLVRLSADGSTLLGATYLGGSGAGPEVIHTLDVDPQNGSIVVAGRTCSADWPTTPAAFQPDAPGNCDGFVSRVAADLTTVEHSTFVGSLNGDVGVAGAIAADGSVLVNTFDTTPPDGVVFTLEGRGAFPEATQADFGQLISFAPDLAHVNWATWVPGAFRTHPRPGGEIVLVGATRDPDFPTTSGAWSQEFVGSALEPEYFTCSISGDGEALIWSTFVSALGPVFGPSSSAIDDEGRVYFVGAISAPNYPFTPDAFDTTLTGLSEPAITVLDPTGSQVLYASLMGQGGGSNELDISMSLDGCNGAFVTVWTHSPDFPVTPDALDGSYGGDGDAWVTRITTLNPWTHLGAALGGIKGRPELATSGPLCTGDPTSIVLTKGPDLGLAFFVLGAAELSAPFKGGTLIPTPDFIKSAPLDGVGARSLAFAWPAGAPSGLQLWLQAWMPDPAAALGWSASNGVLATTP